MKSSRSSLQWSAVLICAALAWTHLGIAATSGDSLHADTQASCSEAPSQTEHEIKLGQLRLRYRAQAGLLPIRDTQTGESRACMFFVTYTLRAGSKHGARPLSFLWNGGPGANSAVLHLEAFGPKRIISAEDPTLPQPAPALEDNAATLLDQSDLVFVDAVGTGFSRATRAEYGQEFYNVRGDIAAMTEFIRVYLARFDVGDVPLFLVGESYGVWRAAGVAESLERHGTRVAGLVLISGGIPVERSLSPQEALALYVPTLTAVASHFKKPPGRLQADLPETLRTAQEWAEGVYAPALANATSLTTQQRQAVVQQLASFTGIAPARIDAGTLVISRQQFATDLLPQGEGVPQKPDGRLTHPEEVNGARIELIERYLRQELKVHNDLSYAGLGDEGYVPLDSPGSKSVNERWVYNQAGGSAADSSHTGGAADPTLRAIDAFIHYGPPGGHAPWLDRAIALDSELRVFVAAGWFDTLNSCAGNARLMQQLDAHLRRNIVATCYYGGHMMYRDREARRMLREDLRTFYSMRIGGS